MQFSKRMERFGQGIFASLLAEKRRLLQEGREVVDLSVGTPNIPPAQHVIDALCAAAADPQSYVYAIQDTDELKEAAAAWYRRRYGVILDPQREVASLLGSQEGLSHIALSIVDDGDVVLVPDPCYPIFGDGPALAGARLAYMPQRKENGYLIDFDEIPGDIARAARLMVVSYPNNPTTAVAPPAFYEALIAFAQRNDILVLHDNAYSELTFNGQRCGSFLAYPGAKEVGVEFNSLSKTYGMAGARVGFCVGNDQIVEKLVQLKSNIDYGMFLPIQRAAIAAITGDQSCVEQTRRAYERRARLLADGLNRIGWKVEMPKATMFLWASLPEGCSDSRDFCLKLLNRCGVLVTPGAAFGPSGEGYVRMALVQEEEAIQQAVEAIAQSGILG